MSLLPDVERALTSAIRREITPSGAPGRARRPRARRAVVIAVAALLLGSATAVAAATGALTSLKDAVDGGATPPAPQSQRPLPVMDGDGRRALDSFRGQIVVVSFIASWCEPCRQEARLVDGAGARLRADGSGTALLIATNDHERFARAFVAQHRLRLSVLVDRDGSVAKAYGVNGIPTTFVLDARGRIVAIRQGMYRDRASLQADIDKAPP